MGLACLLNKFDNNNNNNPEVLVDFHHAFSRVLVYFHPLNVNAKAVDEKPTEVVQEPGFRVAVREFKGQRERVRDDALARV